MPDEEPDNGEFKLETAGEQLRAARQAQKLELAAVAAKTRVPERHLLAIENSEFLKLPGRTYILGFARQYARAVNVSESKIAADLRDELDLSGQPSPGSRSIGTYDPSDPEKIPSSRLVWVAALVGLAMLLGGYGLWRTFFFPGADNPLTETNRDNGVADAPPVGSASATGGDAISGDAADGPVVFTARVEGVWVKFYDGSGRQLMQKQMALGESYTVPSDADSPQIWTGRPDALAITIGGRPVPPLGTVEMVVQDVPVSAQALLARGGDPVSLGGGPVAQAPGRGTPSTPDAPN